MERRSVAGFAVCLLILITAAGGWAVCVGDCDQNGDVVVSELITGINIALGSAPLSGCPSFDDNGDGQVTINELITAINNALSGCPPTSEQCGNGTREGDEECDDGNLWGGDGCAANCTQEQRIECNIAEGADLRLQAALFSFPIPVSGKQIFTVGKPSGNGELPAVIKTEDMRYDPVRLVGVVCACVRGGEMESFGPGNAASGKFGCGTDGLVEVDYVMSVDHTIGDVDPNCENGVREDGSALHPHKDVCNGEPVVTFTGSGPQGSALLWSAMAINLVPDGGTCAENCRIPENGPDCLPCTSDDLGQVQAKSLPLTTGTASGEVVDANLDPGAKISPDSTCGLDLCVASTTGIPMDCELLETGPAAALSGAAFAGALANLDTEAIGDNVVTVRFECR